MAQTTHPRKEAVARIGQISDAYTASEGDLVSGTNSMTAAADGTDVIMFGTFVKDAGVTSDPTAFAKVTRLTAQADKIAGLVVLDDSYDIPNELRGGEDVAGTPTGNAGTSPGLKPGVTATLLRRGRAWVMLDETVAAGDPVRYYAKVVSGKRQGAFRTSDPTGTDTVLISAGARFVTGGTVATGAELEFDCLNMTFSADS